MSHIPSCLEISNLKPSGTWWLAALIVARENHRKLNQALTISGHPRTSPSEIFSLVKFFIRSSPSSYAGIHRAAIGGTGDDRLGLAP